MKLHEVAIIHGSTEHKRSLLLLQQHLIDDLPESYDVTINRDYVQVQADKIIRYLQPSGLANSRVWYTNYTSSDLPNHWTNHDYKSVIHILKKLKDAPTESAFEFP